MHVLKFLYPGVGGKRTAAAFLIPPSPYFPMAGKSARALRARLPMPHAKQKRVFDKLPR